VTVTEASEYDYDPSDLCFPCRDCKAPVYWGDHYSQDGSKTSALFNASNSRKHVCPGPSGDDFDVVPE
jgi:hypothetical protein